MKVRMLLLIRLLPVLILPAMMASCIGPQAKIRKVDLPKEKELRAGWKNYDTYCLGGYAVLFQMKGDKTIQKTDDWRTVTNDETASDCASFSVHPSPVLEMRGENDEIFGYLVHNYNDTVSALIIDPKTIRLLYHVHPKGP